MKITVKIMPKNGVLDPQGKAIAHALESLGFEGVSGVRQGKIIELECADTVSQDELKAMCEKLLANPVIEDYEITT